jgi:Transposase DDE domain
MAEADRGAGRAAGGGTDAQRAAAGAPLRWLFDLLRGPAATQRGGGTWWRGLLVCAIDGTTMTVPDGPASLARFTEQAGNHGGGGYPQVRLLALVACGTRTLIDVVFGPTTSGETSYAPDLLRSLRAGMIVLLDRNFAAGKLIAVVAATQAQVLVRVKCGRKLPALARYRDGSWLSVLGGVQVRVLDCQITITTTAGRHSGSYRLATTLLDPGLYPAAELISLYHERWGAT